MRGSPAHGHLEDVVTSDNAGLSEVVPADVCEIGEVDRRPLADLLDGDVDVLRRHPC